MKGVLITINPKFCEKIASGEKTIEVRKTRPKLEPPFKCLIYQTKSKDNAIRSGKVIGEFICDRITKYLYEPYTDGEHLISYADFEQLGMDGIELYDYLKTNDGYGWHISDLKIYDKPKELKEFSPWCEYKSEIYDIREHYIEQFGGCYKALKNSLKSWCYIEI